MGEVGQFVILLAALTGLLGAVGKLIVDLRTYRAQVNGRLTELLELTRKSSRAQGRLEGPSEPEE